LDQEVADDEPVLGAILLRAERCQHQGQPGDATDIEDPRERREIAIVDRRDDEHDDDADDAERCLACPFVVGEQWRETAGAPDRHRTEEHQHEQCNEQEGVEIMPAVAEDAGAVDRRGAVVACGEHGQQSERRGAKVVRGRLLG
jgi:hypothetical protein